MKKDPCKADLTKRLEEAEYRKKLDKLQKRLEVLHGELYRLRIPVILGFEGWDAAGKGGAIKRLTSHLDPRGYKVCPTASPERRGKNPTTIFGDSGIMCRRQDTSRSLTAPGTEESWWSGSRASVPRRRLAPCISGDQRDGNAFCQFRSSCFEILIQIDKDEQERRFNDRMKNPEKQWKITDEDWRNREKWDAYVLAVNEMLEKTSTKDAPWIVVEGNSKWYARIKVLETVADAMEKKDKRSGKKNRRKMSKVVIIGGGAAGMAAAIGAAECDMTSPFMKK